MSAQFARAPHQGRTGLQPSNPPHAALLIDFDNVTMGIRSDLTKELKNLLNSDIIKGKVAVQRAYADWRRYPQYIVPLAESSVDLIFAPAYGSAKKNATDIRLAIDALELVFTRPEIGTFILLSGDSDFSSLVLKLKEYGKYVIGVGIRESASDLLVQNCDEYYSYSALTGLTRAGDEAPVVSEDPWELVDVAIRQMADNDDVMRSDRLKQVLLELDTNFDEKALGFTKFNKFLQEAANRGVLSLKKQENGQFEIAPGNGTPAGAPDEDEQQRSRRRRGGRGRRGGRDEAKAEAPSEVAETSSAAPAAQPEPPAAPPTKPEPTAGERAPRSRKDPEPPTRSEIDRPEPATRSKAPVRPAAAAAAPVEPVGNDLHAAYALLRRATQDAVRNAGNGVARDSDVKRRLLELDPAWDESNLGFSKFSRFLRRAHDDEIVTLRKLENGNYEVLGGTVEPAEEPQGGRVRRGRGEREPRAPREETTTREAPPGREPAAKTERATASEPATAASAPAAQPATRSAKAEESAGGGRAPRPAQPLGLRRGSRSRGGAPTAPPPLFEGQTARPGGAQQTPAPATGAAAAEPSGAPAWFPTETAAAVEHLAGYKGVGRKTAETLLDDVGIDALYQTLSADRDRVKQVLGPRRGETLLAAFDAQRGEAAAAAPVKAAGRGSATSARKAGGARKSSRSAATKAPKAAATSSEKEPAAKKSGARRGRRGGARKKSAPTK